MSRLCLVLMLFGVTAAAQAHEREFDFWIGEWNVNNRAVADNGNWRDSGLAKARIRPILGGKAILEEWDGQAGGGRANTFGISVRHYDPKTRRWVISLNWPSPQSANFSRMEGSFRHGRAEFFPPMAFEKLPPRATRFTFSDALPDSCRWDMATPVEGGGWRTTWIMEFARTRSAADTMADGEPIRQPPKPGDCVCKGQQARQFDGLVGVWKKQGKGGDATLRITSTNRGCATLCFFEWEQQTPFGSHVARSFEAWAWSTSAKKWVARALDNRTLEFQVLVGEFDDNGAGEFVRTDRHGRTLEQTRRVSYEPVAADRLNLLREVSKDGGKTWKVEFEAELTR